MATKTQIIAFDVDGTLLNDSKQVSTRDRAKLESLKGPDTLRIAATGRNCYSVQKILAPDFPMDYLVFSLVFLLPWDGVNKKNYIFYYILLREKQLRTNYSNR